MAERQKEWQNGRMAEMATYVLFMVHTDDDDDDDDDNDDDNDDNTLIFYITEIWRTQDMAHIEHPNTTTCPQTHPPSHSISCLVPSSLVD